MNMNESVVEDPFDLQLYVIRCKHSLFSQKIKYKRRKANTSCTLKTFQQHIINS